jgi:uncharacterized protein YndB with AHSA1/START domain
MHGGSFSRTRTTALLLTLAWVGGCGGSDSSSPQTPSAAVTPAPRALAAGTTVRIVSGEDYGPVAGARVMFGARQYVSDPAGEIVLTSEAAFGSFMDVVAEGFFSRQTVVPPDGRTRFVLWPKETAAGMTSTFTSQIVYTYAWSEAPAQGSSPLVRVLEGEARVYVWVSAEIRQDPSAGRTHEEAVAEMNRVLEGRITYTLTPSDTSGVVFEVRVAHGGDDVCADSDTTLGYFRAHTNGRGEITGGEIVYCGIDTARSLATVTHELGHSVGLQHVYSSQEVMNQYLMIPRRLRFLRQSFSEREGQAMRLLFERPAGNRFPDTDREVTASAGGDHTIVCR